MKFCFGLFFSLLIITCTKVRDQNASSSQIFPNAVGDKWVYKYYDGYTQGDQYIYVSIVGTGTLPDGQNATIWTTVVQDPTNTKYLIDSSFVVVDDQKAVFYDAPCRICTPPMFPEKRRYIFPLQVGNKWFTSAVFGDTTKVLSNGRVTVPAGTFDSSYQLAKTVGYITNSYTKDTIWLAPHIGVVKYLQKEYNLGPVPGNGLWELTSYQLR